MQTLEALYFPGTEIYSASQFPLFLLFSKIHLLSPVEIDESAGNAADIFISGGLCQAHTPCPLGEQRERFLRLVRDIGERKDDYAAQLSALTVASMSAKKASIDDSSRGIVTSLLGGHGMVGEEVNEEELVRWQARLILKIAELLDREEEEIAVRMALLDDETKGLVKSLQGESESDEEEDTLIAELLQMRGRMNRPTIGAITSRCKAWSRLFSAGMAEPYVWATHMPEAADFLLEKYEERTTTAATPALELELPANIGWQAGETLQRIADFRNDCAELLAQLGKALAPEAEEGQATTLATQWATALEQRFPRRQTGRATVKFHRLSEISCGALLGGKPSTTASLLAVIS